MLPNGVKVTQVRAGCFHPLALTSKGHVPAWGWNGEGQRGDDSNTESSVPVRVDLPAGWRASAVCSGRDAAHPLAIVHKKP